MITKVWVFRNPSDPLSLHGYEVFYSNGTHRKYATNKAPKTVRKFILDPYTQGRDIMCGTRLMTIYERLV